MNQDHVNMIILALLALNTIMMIYCSIKQSSEEYTQKIKPIPKGMSGLPK